MERESAAVSDIFKERYFGHTSLFKHIDPKARIVQHNFLQLVRFAHVLAKFGDPRLLPQIDRIFLESDRGVEFFEAPHYVKLPAQSVRVLLYGATGPSVEDHLAKRLNEQGEEKHQKIFLALLVELGSERSVDAVKQVLDTRGDYEHFAMAVTMLMSVSGPKGRDAVIMAKTDHLDAKSRDYHQRILDSIKAVSFEQLTEAIKKFDASDRVFDDAELSKRLEMYAKTGVDHETNASNVLTSRIRKAELLTQFAFRFFLAAHRLPGRPPSVQQENGGQKNESIISTRVGTSGPRIFLPVHLLGTVVRTALISCRDPYPELDGRNKTNIATSRPILAEFPRACIGCNKGGAD